MQAKHSRRHVGAHLGRLPVFLVFLFPLLREAGRTRRRPLTANVSVGRGRRREVLCSRRSLSCTENEPETKRIERIKRIQRGRDRRRVRRSSTGRSVDVVVVVVWLLVVGCWLRSRESRNAGLRLSRYGGELGGFSQWLLRIRRQRTQHVDFKQVWTASKWPGIAVHDGLTVTSRLVLFAALYYLFLMCVCVCEWRMYSDACDGETPPTVHISVTTCRIMSCHHGYAATVAASRTFDSISWKDRWKRI